MVLDGIVSLCCLMERLNTAPHDRQCDTHFHKESLGILISLMAYTTFHQNTLYGPNLPTFSRALQHSLSLKHVLRAIKVNGA